MEIQKVELLGVTDEEKENGMRPQFYIKTKDGDKMYVLADKLSLTNRHYQEVAAWYDKQKKKPFVFDFENPGE